MSAAVIFEHVSKAYRRGHAPSFREDTVRTFQRLLGRQQPASVVNALADISFEIERGTSFALMGANGSGKTTALKLISRVTYPSDGIVRVAGRVGALIEVGTGLHPELTGRENVWLYGRILGLRRSDIAQRFDRIVEFADIGVAIDQPIKQYSSGMQLRLGFSLASHLEPDVLLVDEAISVGDVGFQRRCVERMTRLHELGATLIFVSHIPEAVTALCTKGMFLRAGQVGAVGPVEDIAAQYLAEMADTHSETSAHSQQLSVRSWDYSFSPSGGRFLGDLSVRVVLRTSVATIEPRFAIAIGHRRLGTLVAASMVTDGYSVGTIQGDLELRCDIFELPLEAGEYELWLTAVGEAPGGYLLGPALLGTVKLGKPRVVSGVEESATGSPPLVRAPYRWEIAPHSGPLATRSDPEGQLPSEPAST